MSTLDHVVFAHDHVVAQIVETEFVIRPVGNIGIVLGFAFRRRLTRGNHPGRHP